MVQERGTVGPLRLNCLLSVPKSISASREPRLRERGGGVGGEGRE